MTKHEIYNKGVLRARWDNELHIYTEFDSTGEEVLSRPFNEFENLVAEEEQTVQTLRNAQSDVERAMMVSAAPVELEALQQLTLQTHGITDGSPWRQPTGAHDAYPVGYKVLYDGKEWENLTPANVWVPGVSGWREIVAEGYPAWVQPTGAHDAYNIGDKVSFEGANYESLIDANVWSPTGYPAGWTLL